MQIDITNWIAQTDLSMLSGSIAELGPRAGAITWQNSCDAVADFNPLPDADALQEFREWLKPWGGWSTEEIAVMSDDHLRALCLQWIAGDWRNAFKDSDDPDWQDYLDRAERGQCSGQFHRHDGRIFWDMTH